MDQTVQIDVVLGNGLDETAVFSTYYRRNFKETETISCMNLIDDTLNHVFSDPYGKANIVIHEKVKECLSLQDKSGKKCVRYNYNEEKPNVEIFEIFNIKREEQQHLDFYLCVQNHNSNCRWNERIFVLQFDNTPFHFIVKGSQTFKNCIEFASREIYLDSRFICLRKGEIRQILSIEMDIEIEVLFGDLCGEIIKIMSGNDVSEQRIILRRIDDVEQKLNELIRTVQHILDENEDH